MPMNFRFTQLTVQCEPTLRDRSSRVLLKKLIVTQLAKEFLAFYGTLRFITVFTRSRHWILS